VKETSANDEGDLVKVIDINWPTDEVNDIRVARSIYLDQGKGAATVRKINAISLSPNANFLLLASENYSTSGTSTKGGEVESWDLAPLSENSSLEPVPAKLRPTGAPVVRLAYSRDSDRVLIWDARGISHVFRVRTSAPPLFRQQVRIPEEDETRFFRPEFGSFRNGRFVSVRFSRDDLRYFDLESGEEHNLSEFAQRRQILDAVWHSHSLDRFTIATDKSLIAVGDGLEKGRVDFSVPASLASVGESVTAVALEKHIEVYRSKDCSQYFKFPIVESPTWMWAEAPCVNSAVVYAIIDSKFCTWTISPDGPGNIARLKKKPAIDLYSDGIRRCSWRVIPGHLIVVKQYKESCSIQFFDLDSGQETDRYKAPPGGWPRDLVSVSNLHVTSDGQTLCFFQTDSGQFYGRWEVSGVCSDWRRIPSGRIVWIDSDDPFARSAVLIDDNNARLISLADGSVKAEFKMEHGIRVPPPAVVEDMGRVIFSPTEQYQSVVRRILLGGLSDAFSITNVGLPADVESELDQLSKSLDSVAGNMQSTGQ
jgi:hypothetical protein